jgi:hypothetical protein
MFNVIVSILHGLCDVKGGGGWYLIGRSSGDVFGEVLSQ